MKITLTKEQMLKRLRSVGGLEPLRTDCTVDVTEGVDVNAAIEPVLRARYLTLLDSGDRSAVAPDNISAMTTARSMADSVIGAYVVVTMPAVCRRVFDLKLRNWLVPVTVRPASEFDKVMALQKNPFTAASPSQPCAVALPGALAGTAPQIMAWPGAAAPQVEIAVAALDPGEDYYTLDEAALGNFLAEVKNIIF